MVRASNAVEISGPLGDLLAPPPGGVRQRKRTIGVNLNRAGSRLVVPDVASLPRALRDRSVKRGLDLILATLLLVLMSPVMLAVAMVLAAGGGPVLFCQRRIGQGRRRFRCLKFRSMRKGAEQRLAALLATDPAARAEWETHQKLAFDPRITRFGRFLRTSSIDELPQLFNVLRGEMSLVGPRPIVAPEVPGYPADRAYFDSEAFNDYAGCRPGITGLWQISGRHQTAHSERVRLDVWYARHWSVVLDLIVLWRTISVVLARTGR